MLSGWITGILGIWMVIVPFLGFEPMGNAWNDWIVGVIVAIAGFSMARARPWQGWIAGIVGVWLFIAGFVPGLREGVGLYWNDILVGITFIVTGFAAAAVSRPPAVPVA
ncbi:MAG TPA: SPW repeat protein [Gemmatimonadaceae bacterium]|nr:SPW repeat protein [Gemmatimonadaceae bacterium]